MNSSLQFKLKSEIAMDDVSMQICTEWLAEWEGSLSEIYSQKYYFAIFI